MNDKEQSLVPELRFPGFEGKWELKAISEVLFERNEQFPEDDEYPLMAFVSKIGVTPKGEKYDRGALVKDAKSKKYKRTELGDFIYSSNNLESGSIGQNSLGKACISPVYSIFGVKENVDKSFIGASLTRPQFISQMVKYRQGVVYGQWKIHESEFLKMTVLLPSFPEQQKIAECLSSLDDEIAGEQEKVEVLKLHKKGLMQQLFPQNGQTTPSKRFPGFEGEWEMKTLGEVAERCSLRNHDLSETRVLTNSATGGVVDQSAYFDRNIAVKENTDNYHIVEKDDFVYNPRVSSSAPVGPISRNKVGRGIMSPLYTIFRFKSEHIDFMEHYFNTSLWHKYLREVANVGARFDRMAISTSDFYAMPLFLPSLPEQQKIADCLSSLDDEIKAQQDKVEALKERKRGLMQKLFPKMGEYTILLTHKR